MKSTDVSAIVAQATATLTDRTSDFLDVGFVLRDLQDADGEEYKRLVSKTKIGSRQAYYWVSIARAFDGLGVTREKLRKVGWTKLKELATHVSKDNVKDLLALAEKNTAKDLERLLTGQETVQGARSVNLRFSPDDYDLLQQALLKYGAIPAGRGLEAKEDAIMAIVREVLSKGE